MRWTKVRSLSLRQVSSWCCGPKVGQCFTELFKK